MHVVVVNVDFRVDLIKSAMFSPDHHAHIAVWLAFVALHAMYPFVHGHAPHTVRTGLASPDDLTNIMEAVGWVAASVPRHGSSS